MPTPLQLDFSKAKPINQGGGVTLDFSKAQPIASQGGSAPSSTPPDPSMLQKAAGGVGDFFGGIGSGALHTLATIGYPAGVAAHAIAPKYFPPASLSDPLLQAPNSTAGRVGRGIEQAGEFMLPGGAEEKGAAKLAEMAPWAGRAAKPLAKVLTSGISAGAVNTAQGGSPVTGALMGAGGSAIGQGLKAAAPTLTGIAQGLKAPFGKTGTAILDETKGVLPGSVRNSARGVLDTLNPALNDAADKSTAMIPMQPAREAASAEIGNAQTQNNPRLIKGIKRMGNQLMTRDFEPGLGAEGPSARMPIPDEVPARDYLELKRGIGKALPAGSWSPESSNAFKGPRNAIYGQMGKDFEQAVPEAAPLNQRISALIPATEKPKNFFFGHALGPGVGATLGGVGGYRRGIGSEGTDIGNGLKEGAMGAIGGAAAGYAAPAAMNAAARMVWSPALGRYVLPAAEGAILQGTRNKENQ